MSFVRDSLGIPKLNREGVESVAERFLARIAPYALDPSCLLPTNLGYILRELEQGGFCTFSHDGDLGFRFNGSPCLGAYSFSRTHLTISKDLPRLDPRYVFTCAHELGHFYLHDKVNPSAYQEQGEVEVRDSARDFVSLRSENAPRSLMEWQANRFAASILMPRATVQTVLAKIQWDLGIGRRGRIWLDNQKQAEQDYMRTVRGMAQHYHVSYSVVALRLKELQLIDSSRRYELHRIRDTDLEDAIRELFVL